MRPAHPAPTQEDDARTAVCRIALALLSLAACLSACAPNHSEMVVEIAASKHPRTCDGRFTLKKLSAWAYRVDACEGTLFYQCGYKRRSGGSQCCDLVEGESAATALVSTVGGDATCVQFAD